MREGNAFIKGTYTKYLIYEEKDRPVLRELYKNWFELSKNMQAMGAKQISVPQVLAEGLFSLETGAVRVISSNHSFDCYDFRNDKCFEIKASIGSSETTLLKTEIAWDQLYFFDFYGKNGIDGTYDVYLISREIISDFLMNTSNNMKFRRINIYKNIILKYNLQPVTTLRI